MKSYTKQQLAAFAEVSLSTFNRWLRSIHHKLQPLGYRPSMRLLPPNIVKAIVDHFCIDIPNR